jgi:hypothetical protein
MTDEPKEPAADDEPPFPVSEDASSPFPEPELDRRLDLDDHDGWPD